MEATERKQNREVSMIRITSSRNLQTECDHVILFEIVLFQRWLMTQSVAGSPHSKKRKFHAKILSCTVYTVHACQKVYVISPAFVIKIRHIYDENFELRCKLPFTCWHFLIEIRLSADISCWYATHIFKFKLVVSIDKFAKLLPVICIEKTNLQCPGVSEHVWTIKSFSQQHKSALETCVIHSKDHNHRMCFCECLNRLFSFSAQCSSSFISPTLFSNPSHPIHKRQYQSFYYREFTW